MSKDYQGQKTVFLRPANEAPVLIIRQIALVKVALSWKKQMASRYGLASASFELQTGLACALRLKG